MTLYDAKLIIKHRITEKDLEFLAPDIKDAILTVQKNIDLICEKDK